MGVITIVVLCDDYKMAEYMFSMFSKFLLDNTPWDVVRVFESSNMIEVDAKIRYLFIDHRFIDMIDENVKDIEIMDQDEFFYDIYAI